MFQTKGVGIHKDKLTSFEFTLRQAGIQKSNLLSVSSILPPQCEIITCEEGLKLLQPGQITYCVMARNQTDESSRLVSAAIGIAVPMDQTNYGYVSEHHSFGEIARHSRNYAEDLAATMFANTLGIPFDPNQAWDERKKVYHASGHIFKTRHICQSAEGNNYNLWTTVITAAVFILE
jgi:arginine decarboxylase